MAHWYEFKVPELGHVVCKADRSWQVKEILAPQAELIGCISRERIPLVKENLKYTVFNSVASLREALQMTRPDLLKTPSVGER